MNKVIDINEDNKRRAILSLVISSLIVVFQMIGLMINVANVYHVDVPEAGLNTFRMFTTISNMLVAVSASLTIPFQIDGLRKNDYHLPRWIIDLLYTSCFCTTLTFCTAITGITISKGFFEAMINRANIFEHTLNPILAIVLFVVISPYHHLNFRKTFISFIPMVTYTIVYLIMAIIVGENNGGWRDHYMFNMYIPWYFSLLFMYSFAFGISTLLRILHNRNHKKLKQKVVNYYMNSSDYDVKTVEEAIRITALYNKKFYKEGDIFIPVRIIKILASKYNTELKEEELVATYLKNFLNN